MSQDGGKELRLHLSDPELRQAAQREIEEAETPPSVGGWRLAWLRASFARAEVHMLMSTGLPSALSRPGLGWRIASFRRPIFRRAERD
jgi:hypothetical protein